MQERSHNIGGDFVRVATCGTPTEAHLLKGVLESAGLAAQVADANIVQANTWMTQAVGGVRVLVPASQVAAAQKAIAEFNAGSYKLEGDDDEPAVSYAAIPSPVFSPDQAVLLSFVLTPAFGAAVQLANAAIVGQAPRTGRWIWFVLLASLSLVGIAAVHQLSPGPFVAFRASFVISFITVVWYFLAGQNQSKAFLATYGPRYTNRSLFIPSLLSAIGLLALGWAMSEFV